MLLGGRMAKTPALFLDRDGTIIFDKHHIHDPRDVRLVPETAAALAAVRAAGYRLFISTNQSGIGRGYFTWAQYEACNARMLELLGLGDDLFTEIKAAPEVPDVPSLYRKPSPRFIEEMVAKYALDLAASWMVGDRPSDWEAGLNAGIRGAAVRTGKEIGVAEEVFLREKKVPVFASLPCFVREALGIHF